MTRSKFVKTQIIKSHLGDDHRQFKDHHRERRIFQQRILISFCAACLLFVVIAVRFYDLQISNFENYSTQSDKNRIQVRPIPPNRGLFYDRSGRVIADNRAVSTLMLTIERVKSFEHTLADLRQFIDITEQDEKNFYRALKYRRRPYQAVPLKYNLSEEEIARIAVNEFAIDGISVSGQLVRFYPYKHLFTHVAGYVGSINGKELAAFSEEESTNYSGTQTIGKIGIEKYYEAALHGQVGQEKIETDARGRVIRVLETIDPIAGGNIELFLDADLQKQAFSALAGRRGSVIAIDIETGGVLTMLSSPSYDPNLFVTGISSKDYKALNTNLNLPLFDRSIQAQYPPGSTIKPMLGLGALDESVITTSSTIYDPGYYQIENDKRLYREWKRGGHGESVDLYQAIVESCDIFFYDIGKRMGVDRMHPFGQRFGFGQKTNVDLPSERRGLWPSREWKKNVLGLSWFPGHSLNMSIGQGDVLATPLQLAVMTAMMARRGTYIEPRVARRIDGELTPTVVRQVYPSTLEHWDYVLRSMRDVVHSRAGTAQVLSDDLDFIMAGKTGTAQVVGIAQNALYDSEALSERNRDHALFVGYAPYDQPRIAVAVVIENGEKSSEAGEVAKQVMTQYLHKEGYIK